MKNLFKKLILTTLTLSLLIPFTSAGASVLEDSRAPEPAKLYIYYVSGFKYDLAFEIPRNSTATDYALWNNGTIVEVGKVDSGALYMYTHYYNQPNGIYNLKVTLYNFFGSADSNSVELVLNAPEPYWIPGKVYEKGDIVQYVTIINDGVYDHIHDATYKCILDHTSLSCWSPIASPTLWERIN